MSSRILRPGDPSIVEPLHFRPAFGAAPRPPARTSISVTQSAEPSSTLTDADIQSRMEAARTQARAEGEAQGFKQASAKLDPVIQSLNHLIEDLSSQRKRLRAEAEEDTVKLALAIARRVLHREIATDPEAMLGLVKAAFAKLNARDTHRLRVSPSDADLLEQHRAKLNLPAAVTINPDTTLLPGSAVFETARGEMDASIDTQLSEIDRGLTDVLRRRIK
jgi:flagellar assembly protein FliH